MPSSLARLFAATAAVVAIAAPAFSQPASAPKRSSPGVYQGWSPKLYTERQRTSQYVAVRDGTKLAVDIYRPTQGGRAVETAYPVVWAFSPYRRVHLENGQPALSGGLRLWDVRKLTDYGYVVAVVDTRGRGASFGARRGMQSSGEGQDGYDINEWLAVQPLSDGKVGMTGCSYVGGTQDNVAQFAPPHLKAIFPGATVFNRYDFVSRGGMTAQYHTRPEQPGYDLGEGVLPVDEDRDGAMLKTALEEHRANTVMPDTWKDIPYRDDWSPLLNSRYWDESSPSARRNDIERSGIAMYRWASWQDEFSADQFVAFANYRNPRKVLMLGTEHCVPGDFDLFAEQHRFFDYWLKGIDNGLMAEPPIYYRTYNAPSGQEGRFAQAWPLPQTVQTRYFLQPGVTSGKASSQVTGLASSAPGKAQTASFAVDYSVLVNDGSTPSWIPSQDGHGLSFQTAPLAADMEVTGHPVVDLWLSANTPDADVFAYLEEVAADGKAVVRAHGRLRASHRALGTAPYDYLNLPYHRSFRADARPLTPGEPARLTFDLVPTSTIVKAGSRLRLVVAGADSRQRTGPPATPPPRLTIHTGGDKASFITLPVIPAGTSRIAPAT